MKKHYTSFIIFLSFSSQFITGIVHSGELSGYIGAQNHTFFDNPLNAEQHNNNLSVVSQAEYFHEWDNRSQNLELKIFYRKDRHDEKRTHADIRELAWTGVYDDWEILAGISKVYWGVTETQHLVDIVNQTDQVENLDGEDKLGQPMLKASTEREWGVLDFLILPGFRERTFSGIEGRPRFNNLIDTDRDAIYDFNAGRNHIDAAARYSHYIDEIEFGISAFSGIGREPTNFEEVAVTSSGAPIVVPVYSLINQIGFDGQAFFGDWTCKLEATNTKVRSGNKKGINSLKTVTGFEYTIVGISETAIDLGFVIEYHYSDERINITPFNNDLATALRFILNDAQSTEILTGFTTDLDTQTIASFIEATRRLGENWTLDAQIRTFHATSAGRPLYSFRADDFAQIDLNYHF